MNIIDDDFKYTDYVFKNLNRLNVEKIILFLEKENCHCISDIISDYLDIFTIDYDIFVKKYSELNKKYDNKYLEFVMSDMNLLEELFYD